MENFDVENCHCALIKDPKEFKYFRREQKEDGVFSQIGIREDESEEVQKVYFIKSMFNNDQAVKWLSDNNYQVSKLNKSGSRLDGLTRNERTKRIAEIYLRF